MKTFDEFRMRHVWHSRMQTFTGDNKRLGIPALRESLHLYLARCCRPEFRIFESLQKDFRLVGER